MIDGSWMHNLLLVKAVKHQFMNWKWLHVVFKFGLESKILWMYIKKGMEIKCINKLHDTLVNNFTHQSISKENINVESIFEPKYDYLNSILSHTIFLRTFQIETLHELLPSKTNSPNHSILYICAWSCLK